jgi:hypothetical protein
MVDSFVKYNEKRNNKPEIIPESFRRENTK